ncbi:anaphase-promoting complex subunit 10 [Nematocida sp. LUAm3]|nr:anaphase-promoting complex subunit 10 [Nematocida sp. LUAm3]KAI5173737.1 anaphase-promoting complex subunit 10 [Nematocida sp. LUAm2]KAI5176960.1 anaphase-promoting complex subunit 10 [Nematocida sp. LUAm1]
MEARVSTFKVGHGAEELFCDSTEKYWHTDGNLPHHIEIDFPEIKKLLKIKLTIGNTQDKTYIPKEIDIRCGKTKDSIVSIKKAQINEKLSSAVITVNELCCHLQMVILSNHQEGRDSRIRGLSLIFED